MRIDPSFRAFGQVVKLNEKKLKLYFKLVCRSNLTYRTLKGSAHAKMQLF